MAWQPPASQRPPQGYGNQQQQSQGSYGYPQGAGAGAQQYWPPVTQQQYAQYPAPPDYSNANTVPVQTQYSAAPAYSPQQPPGYYPSQGQPPAYSQEQWADNWDWGWDDAARHNAPSAPAHNAHYSNANIEESFASTDTWNWAADDTRQTQDTPNANQQPAPTPAPALPVENNVEPPRSSSAHSVHAPVEEVKSLGDRDAVKERLPNLALGKRLHLDDLTPQWSIESQMSQESSDGPHTHSEGTYRSENQSRGSSSPGPNTDHGNYNYAQPIEEGAAEWGRGDGCALTDGLQDLSLANREVPEPLAARRDSSAAPASEPALLPPPTGFATSAAANPFKQHSPFSHKKLSPSAASFPTPTFSANLEMAPDNAERPDAAPPAATPARAPAATPPAPPDNLEVAGREQYMQTALAADYNAEWGGGPRPLVQGGGDDGPPRGLARLVPGRHAEPTQQRPRADGQPDMERARLPPGDGRATPPPAAPAPPPDDVQRELTVDGENLQDLSVVSSAELSPVAPPDPPRRIAAAAPPAPRSDDSERAYNASPAATRRDKHKATRDRDSDGRYSRGERPLPLYDRERDERRSQRDDRRSQRDERREERRGGDRERRRRDERGDSPPRRRRYDTDDTDYCSDRERERRRYREGSHGARPPRPERDRERESERRREPARRRYRDIDPARMNTVPRSHRTRETAGGERDREHGSWSGGSGDERRRAHAHRTRHAARHRDGHRDYYDVSGYGSTSGAAPARPAYSLTPQQYAYYEALRRSDPPAYLRVYTQLMGHHGHHQPHAIPGYGAGGVYGAATGGGGGGGGGAGSEARGSERGSGHSGRSSAQLRNDTYYGAMAAAAAAEESLRGAALSLRTDFSDRDLNTDASLNLQLEESTVRSDRMTPLKYCTAHVKGVVSSRGLVVVRGQYPADGRPAGVALLALRSLAHLDPRLDLYQRYPGPLLKGVSHKKSVIEYCSAQAREAAEGGGGGAGRDPVGGALLWDLLALMLTQNGVVVGADIAELLMKSQREQPNADGGSGRHRHRPSASRRGSWLSEAEDRAWSRQPSPTHADHKPVEDTPGVEASGAALDTYREYLTYGNRQQALEWAMSHGLWGHALQLSAFAERRVRALVAARFLAALPPRDPLHTLYSHLAGRQPPAATCCADERWADWRAHAAVVLANASHKPEQDACTMTQLGDSLCGRGLLYSAQFCYVAGGVGWGRHPLAPLQPPAPPSAHPPRLALLLADPKAATLAQLATDQAIIATEIYEYAMSLNQDYCIPELQVYKLMMACRLVDVGLYARALGYLESAARCVASNPRAHSPALAAQLAALADRLRCHDDAGDAPDAGDGGDGSPHQHWIDGVISVANMMQREQCEQAPPQPPHEQYPPHAHTHVQPTQTHTQLQCEPQYAAWGEQNSVQPMSQPSLPAPAPTAQTYADPEQVDYTYPGPADVDPPIDQSTEQPNHDQWAHTPAHTEDATQAYPDYWQGYAGYSEPSNGPRALITMPGGSGGGSAQAHYNTDDDQEHEPRPRRESESSQPAPLTKPSKSKEAAGDKSAGWLGGILTKLSLRAPNQMILPDDRNPKIVWDADRKRWRDLDGDGTEELAPPPPPPPAARPQPPTPLSSSSPLAPPPAPAPAPAPGSNMLRMQKSRNIKKSYVDVFNGSGGGGGAPRPAAAVPAPPAPLAQGLPTNYFVPSSTHTQLSVRIPPSPHRTPLPSPIPSLSNLYES